MFLIMALNTQTTMLVYWVYNLSNDVSSVGLMGLFEAIPAISFSLISGHIVDQREKRKLIITCVLAYAILNVGYFALALRGPGNLEPMQMVHLIYAGIFVGGMLRAFISPSTFALMGMLVPRDLYPNASTWSSSAWQMGAILGPLIGGMLIAVTGIPIGLCIVVGLILVSLFSALSIPAQAILKKEKEPVLDSLRQGARFVFNTQVILAALMLDMFAVLFGGAIALLPVYARDILKVGEVGFGWMRAAPGIGAIVTFAILANKPLKTKAGIKMILCVAGFGISLIIFGVSKNFALSMAMLTLSGAFDAVSVVIRGTILQLFTPDAMRGRVAALNTMFISSSNELGEVESGFTAKWMGTVPAVVFGGCMTLLIAGITYFATPKIRTLKLEAPKEDES
jgi:MFS family permease